MCYSCPVQLPSFPKNMFSPLEEANQNHVEMFDSITHCAAKTLESHTFWHAGTRAQGRRERTLPCTSAQTSPELYAWMEAFRPRRSYAIPQKHTGVGVGGGLGLSVGLEGKESVGAERVSVGQAVRLKLGAGAGGGGPWRWIQATDERAWLRVKPRPAHSCLLWSYKYMHIVSLETNTH